MGAGEIIAIIVSALIIVGALTYIIRAKKQGKKCIGCPESASCTAGKCAGSCSSCSCGCGCNTATDNTNKED